jgi:hypothetical protein
MCMADARYNDRVLCSTRFASTYAKAKMRYVSGQSVFLLKTLNFPTPGYSKKILIFWALLLMNYLDLPAGNTSMNLSGQ